MSGDADWITWGPPYMGGPFKKYSTAYGISGLALDDNGTLNLLAIDADNPGTGQFRAFLLRAKDSFRTIRVFHLFNPALDFALRRYGFRAVKESPCEGEPIQSSVLRWDMP